MVRKTLLVSGPTRLPVSGEPLISEFHKSEMGKKKKKDRDGGVNAAPAKDKPKRKEPEPEITLGEAMIAFQ